MCWRFNFEKIFVTYKITVYCANELPESLNAKEWWAEKLRSEISTAELHGASRACTSSRFEVLRTRMRPALRAD